MEFAGGLISIAVAIALVWFGKPPKGSAEVRPIFRSWPVLITFVSAVMVLFIGGVAAVITNWGS
jgi:hypothetical protein